MVSIAGFQKDFAEIIGSNLTYVNRLKIVVKIEMFDKISNNLNKYNNLLNITSSDLIKYNEKYITKYTRRNEKK